MYISIPYSGNVKKLADSIKSDETAISKLKDEEKNKLEVRMCDNFVILHMSVHMCIPMCAVCVYLH